MNNTNLLGSLLYQELRTSLCASLASSMRPSLVMYIAHTPWCFIYEHTYDSIWISLDNARISLNGELTVNQ